MSADIDARTSPFGGNQLVRWRRVYPSDLYRNPPAARSPPGSASNDVPRQRCRCVPSARDGPASAVAKSRTVAIVTG